MLRHQHHSVSRQSGSASAINHRTSLTANLSSEVGGRRALLLGEPLVREADQSAGQDPLSPVGRPNQRQTVVHLLEGADLGQDFPPVAVPRLDPVCGIFWQPSGWQRRRDLRSAALGDHRGQIALRRRVQVFNRERPHIGNPWGRKLPNEDTTD